MTGGRLAVIPGEGEQAAPSGLGRAGDEGGKVWRSAIARWAARSGSYRTMADWGRPGASTRTAKRPPARGWASRSADDRPFQAVVM